MKDELKDALSAMRVAERQWNDAEPVFENAALIKFQASKAKVDAVIRGCLNGREKDVCQDHHRQ